MPSALLQVMPVNVAKLSPPFYLRLVFVGEKFLLIEDIANEGLMLIRNFIKSRFNSSSIFGILTRK